MNYTEYIKLVASKFDLSDSDISLLLVNQEQLIPNPTDEVDVRIAKTAICKEFANLIPFYSSVTEGGMTVAVNLDAMKLWLKMTAAELGLDVGGVTQPTVRNRSNLW